MSDGSGMGSSLSTITLGTKQVSPLPIKPLHRMVIVYPLFDADRVGVGERIWIPDVAKNPESQQGYVVAKGPESEFDLLDLVVYHPFSANEALGAIRFEGETYYRIWDHDILGKVVDRSLIPRAGDVLVLPGWDNVGERTSPSGIIAIDRTVYSAPEPPRFGTVLACGPGCTEVVVGDQIVIPEVGGEEIGWIDRVIYRIPERELLGKVIRPQELSEKEWKALYLNTP